MTGFDDRFGRNDSYKGSRTCDVRERDNFRLYCKRGYDDFDAVLVQNNEQVLLYAISRDPKEHNHIFRFLERDYPEILRKVFSIKNDQKAKALVDLIEIVRIERRKEKVYDSDDDNDFLGWRN